MRIEQELEFLLQEGLKLASEAIRQPAKRGERRERSKNWRKRLRVVRKAIQKEFGGRLDKSGEAGEAEERTKN